MRQGILFVLFLLSVSLVSGELFLFYDENVYTVKRIFNQQLHEAVFSLYYDLQVESGVESEEISKLKAKIVEITILEKGFKPEKIEIKRNQTVVWKNERGKLSALVMGMREISPMKKSLEPGESFSYSFSEPGKYFYVDGIVIGYKGEIVVVR